MLEAAARAGEALIEQRDLCQTTRGGSTFSRWCEEHLPFGKTTVYAYIKVSENWKSFGALNDLEQPPSIRESLKLIAEAKREEREAERESEPDVELPDGTRVITDLAEVAGEIIFRAPTGETMTVEEAFNHAPDSAEKTALIANFNALFAEIGTAAAAAAFSPLVQAQLESLVVDLAEVVAGNMTDHV